MNKREGVTHTVAINQFADLTDEEFKNMYLTEYPDIGEIPSIMDSLPEDHKRALEEIEIPSDRELRDRALGSTDYYYAKNWCNEGYCNPIKNQQTCGSCWAFSGQVALESFYKH